MSKKRKRLKPISFYGHKPEDVIRAFMQVDPKKVKEAEEREALDKDSVPQIIISDHST